MSTVIFIVVYILVGAVVAYFVLPHAVSNFDTDAEVGLSFVGSMVAWPLVALGLLVWGALSTVGRLLR